jgi:hypothetical protein
MSLSVNKVTISVFNFGLIISVLKDIADAELLTFVCLSPHENKKNANPTTKQNMVALITLLV